MIHRPSFTAFLLLISLAACSPAPVATPTEGIHMAPFVLVTVDPHSTATATPFQPNAAATPTRSPNIPTPSASPVPSDTSTPAPVDTSTPTPPTAAVTLAAVSPTPTQQASDRTQYTFYLTLDYAGHNVAVNETIRYVNTTGQSLSDVVLAVEPNLWSNCFNLASLSQDEAEVTNYTLSGQRLTIVPDQPIAPGAVTTFKLGFSLSMPVKHYDGTFGYVSGQMNLTDWYPFIVPFISGNWVLHDTWSFGEHLVYEAADYDAYVKVTDPNVVVAASAPGQADGETTHYHLEGARTFVLSASTLFQVDESAVGHVKIRSYHFPGDGGASQGVVWMATQSLGLYEAKFAPYPYESLSIVETDVPDGQEYDGLVFLSTGFYSSYGGSARSNLYTIGTHEIAHQWWFGLVGDDQATQPWLDEAMAVYSERIFYEYNYPNFGNWWWNFRVNYFGPQGYVDSSIYSFGTFRDYVDAVYLNGAVFLDHVRSRMGDEAFFAFLKDYASTYAHRIVTTSDYFALLRQHTKNDLSDLIQLYFQGSY